MTVTVHRRKNIMTEKKRLSRRTFLAAAAAGASVITLPQILPSGVLARNGQPGANDRIGVGVIGPGRQGSDLMSQYPRKGAQLVAFADCYQERLKRAQKRFRKTALYQDYRELLEDSNVDAVIIATPDHWHALNTIHACEAGKDVYVEKPMNLTIREGQLMVAAAQKYGRVVTTGSMQRSMEACRIGCELVRNGRAGKIHTVHTHNYPSPWECDLPEQPVPEGMNWDMWCGQTEPRPYHELLYAPRGNGKTDSRGPLGWISYRPYSGGEVTGWGPHGLDLIQWALGMDGTCPVELWPEGEGGWAPVSFRYANGITVHLDGKGPAGGGVFVGDAGKILVDRNKYDVRPKSLAQEPIGESEKHLEVSTNHMQNWLDCIRSRQKPITTVEVGHSTTTLCHLINITRWVGKKLRWDPETERFDDEEANSHIARTMRAPYNLD
jgi:predicted dehydrogenase